MSNISSINTLIVQRDLYLSPHVNFVPIHKNITCRFGAVRYKRMCGCIARTKKLLKYLKLSASILE